MSDAHVALLALLGAIFAFYQVGYYAGALFAKWWTERKP